MMYLGLCFTTLEQIGIFFYVNLSPTEILIMNRFFKKKKKKPYVILRTT